MICGYLGVDLCFVIGVLFIVVSVCSLIVLGWIFVLLLAFWLVYLADVCFVWCLCGWVFVLECGLFGGFLLRMLDCWCLVWLWLVD